MNLYNNKGEKRNMNKGKKESAPVIYLSVINFLHFFYLELKKNNKSTQPKHHSISFCMQLLAVYRAKYNN